VAKHGLDLTHLKIGLYQDFPIPNNPPKPPKIATWKTRESLHIGSLSDPGLKRPS
jgi:hypothetical protein